MERKEEKIKEANLLPILLFIVVLINYIPIIKVNFLTKTSNAIGTKAMAISLGIECVILLLYYFRKIKLKKEMFINFVILVGITICSLVVQIINYKSGNYNILDFANIACKFINIFLLYIIIMGLEIKEKYINWFMGLIVIMGLVACIYNMIFYYNDILANLGLIENVKTIYSCKSFFPQKNPFAFFLFSSIISTIFLLQKDSKFITKLILFLLLGIFGFNLVLTFSRTGTAITIMFLGLFFLFTNKINWKVKLILIILGVVGICFGYSYVKENNPKLLDKILRLESVKTFTGRTIFWDLSKEMLEESPANMILGVGRFKAVKLIEKYKVTQFHNTYVEFLVSGGIVELVYFLSIYVMVSIKVLKSKMEKKYKSIYIPMIVSFLAYMYFESLGRFSIGWSDTMCMIFFITIPLLHATSCNKIEEHKEECEEK